MRIDLVAGTRPEITKSLAVAQAVEKLGHSMPLLLTGQQVALVRDALVDLANAEAISATWLVDAANASTAEGWRHIAGSRLLEHWENHPPAAVAVLGDTDSARLGAALAFSLGICVAHLEAGIRHSLVHQPCREERNRVAISRVADLHFCPTEHEASNLLEAGIDPDGVFVAGEFSKLALFSIEQGASSPPSEHELRSKLLAKCPSVSTAITAGYSVATLHRKESLNHTEELAHWMLRMADRWPSSYLILVSRPDTRWKAFYEKVAKAQNILVVPSLSPRLFHHLCRDAAYVITDSAGVQQENLLIGKRVLVLREQVELQAGHELLQVIPPPFAWGEPEMLSIADAKRRNAIPESWGRQAHSVAQLVLQAVESETGSIADES